MDLIIFNLVNFLIQDYDGFRPQEDCLQILTARSAWNLNKGYQKEIKRLFIQAVQGNKNSLTLKDTDCNKLSSIIILANYLN